MMKKVLVLLCLLLSDLVSAQDFPYRWMSQTVTSPSDEYRSLFFNHKGLMWIGTSSGLKAFDGYDFYTTKSTATSPGLLPNNTVLAIAEDKDGNLWIGTRNGLVKVNQMTGEHYTFPITNDKMRSTNTIFISHDGTVWIGNSEGLCKYLPQSNTFYKYDGNKVEFVDTHGKVHHYPNYGVMSITEDGSGNIYFGTWNKGLFVFSPPQRNRFYQYPKLNKGNSAYSLFFDSKNRLWIGSWGFGLLRLDHPHNILSPGIHTFQGSGSFDTFYKVIEDPVTRTIWASTREGIYILGLDEDMKKARFYSSLGGKNHQDLRFCNDMETDGQGNIWIETLNDGIIHVNTVHSPFQNWDLKNAGYKLPINSICSLFTPDGRYLWMTMKPYGIVLFDRFTRSALFNRSIPGFNTLPDDFMKTSITSIAKRFNGEIWLASNSYGIAIYTPQRTVIHQMATQVPYLQDNYVNALFQDSHHVMWIGQQSCLSIAYPNNKGTKLTMTENGEEFSNCDIRNIMEDSRKRIWVSTDNEGIIRIEGNVFRPTSLRFHHYSPMHGNYVVDDATACFEDSHHRLWAISNSGGLFQYDETEDKFISVNEKYGIPGDRIFSINEDSDGNLWMTTDNALIRLPYGKSTVSISAYGEEDGLANLLFYPNSSVRWGNQLFFGTKQGFFFFTPQAVAQYMTAYKPQLMIVDLIIDDKSFEALDSTLRKKISKTLPPYAREITIPSSVNKFAVAYALLSYSNQELVKYAYLLEGYDKDWHFSKGSLHRAFFENIPSGTYQLHVKAADSNGNWTELPYTLKIKVLPPWYASWWAYLIYFLFTVFAIFSVIRWYDEHLKTKNRLQMAVVFTNITHELLTPLTIISAAVDEIKGKAPQYKEDYSLIQSNIARLTRLLRQILEVRKSQAGQLRLLVSKQDLAAFVNSEVNNIRPMATARGITISTSIYPQPIIGWFDRDKMDKILYNLISNAIKYNQENGKIEIALSTTGNNAILSIADSGIGMSKDKLQHLFTRFLDGDYRKTGTTGTGIGLSLTHDLVTLHHGTIRCQSEEHQGTQFTVTIPIHEEAYTREEKDTGEKPEKADNQTMAAMIPEEAHIYVEGEPAEEGYTILIVEDNVQLLELMRRLLSHKYHVLTAKNGQQALKIIHQSELDIVISDVMMPVMDGIELTHAIKQDEDYAQLPVVLLTAKTADDDRNEAYATGADEYITKPFQLAYLQLRIDNIIANRERIRRKFNRQTDFNVEEQHYSSPDEIFVQKAIDCVMSHLNDTDFNRESFASDMCVSSSTLYNKLRALTGQNIVGFITSIRLKEALKIVRKEPHILLTDLSSRVGFNNPKYFSKCFKRQFGMLPKEYIEKNNK